MKKRGQITIFIILGILLLIAIALIVIFRREITVFQPERVLPPELAPVASYGDNCLEAVVMDGLHLMGAQGGYIYFPSEIENNPLSYIDTGLKIPYWQYITDNRIPSLGLMEAHLSRYIEEHINDCLEGFEPFQDQYDFIQKGAVEAETTIGDVNVVVEMEYPFEVVNKEGTKITDLDSFKVILPVKLKRVYEVAKQIMETESEDNKLEKVTIDLISLDPEIPISGFELSCSQKIWQVNEVESKLKTLLRTNLPLIRVDKTSYAAVPDDQPYILNHFVWDVTESTYRDIKASIQFNEINPLMMAVTPRDGNLLKSGMQQGQDIASFVCMQMWKFTYDVQYTVVVAVEDVENNFALNFGFNVQVKDNRPSRDILGAATQTFVQYDATAEAYCAEENKYGNYNMKIYTYDNVSDPTLGESSFPIHNVDITFTCLKFKCEMGKTKFEQGGAISVLEARFPYCVNGILRANKEGYQETFEFVTTVPGKEVSLYLKPLHIIDKYSVVKHELVNGVLSAAQPLAEGESAFITIKYVENETIKHSTSGAYPAILDGELQPIELLAEADFTYDLEVYLMDDEDLIGGFNSAWTPLWTDLGGSDEIVFHVVEVGAPVSEQQTLSFLNNIKTYSSQIIPELK
ncbi:MAG: hypothetical protein KAT77_04440 [Nanoarchaeota archaeon]|nr:hypothetical protein [Nanoarchaeota archaeon]